MHIQEKTVVESWLFGPVSAGGFVGAGGCAVHLLLGVVGSVRLGRQTNTYVQLQEVKKTCLVCPWLGGGRALVLSSVGRGCGVSQGLGGCVGPGGERSCQRSRRALRRSAGHASLNHPRPARAAITPIRCDRDRCDRSVLTHFHTTSAWLEVTGVLPGPVPAAGQHNDARMNLAIALTAARYGAATANYAEVLRLLKTRDPASGKERVRGVRCRDVLTGACLPRGTARRGPRAGREPWPSTASSALPRPSGKHRASGERPRFVKETPT